MIKFDTPKTDQLLAYIAELRRKGNLTDKESNEFHDISMEFITEVYSGLDTIYNNTLAKKRWLWFGLGIGTALVLGLVGLTIYCDYFK